MQTRRTNSSIRTSVAMMTALSEKTIHEATVSLSAVSLSKRSEEEVVVQLRCSDGKEIELDEATALMSGYVRKRLERSRRLYKWERVRIKLSGNEHLTHMPSDLVEKVFHYCSRHAHAQPGEEDLEAFDAQFLNLDYPELCKLLKAALRFDIDCLWERANVALDGMAAEGVDPYYGDLLTLPF